MKTGAPVKVVPPVKRVVAYGVRDVRGFAAAPSGGRVRRIPRLEQ